MLALSVRQPFAELILRGIKRVEYRTRPTRIIGQRFWIYAAHGPRRKTREFPSPIIADNIAVPTEPLPQWMVELAEQLKLIEPESQLPKGVIVGSAVIEKVTPCDTAANHAGGRCFYRWHLADVERISHPRRPLRRPQPVWFRPF